MDVTNIVGTQLHLIILPIVAGVLLALAALFALFESRSRYSDDGFAISSVVSGTFGIIILAVFLIVLTPFNGKYHQMYRVTGDVIEVSNILTESSGELTSTPVLEIEGIDRPVTMNDPRAVQLQGKNVTFTCAIGWNYKAADTYSCSIYQIN